MLDGLAWEYSMMLFLKYLVLCLAHIQRGHREEPKTWKQIMGGGSIAEMS